MTGLTNHRQIRLELHIKSGRWWYQAKK